MINPKNPQGCRLICISTSEGTDYGCEYKYAGEVLCDECVFSNWPGTYLDPRFSRYTQQLSPFNRKKKRKGV